MHRTWAGRSAATLAAVLVAVSLASAPRVQALGGEAPGVPFDAAHTGGLLLAFGGAPGIGGGAGDDTLAAPVAVAGTADGAGALVVDAAGHVRSHGTAPARGELGAAPNQPIAAAAVTPSGEGYWLIARDGGVFTFGDAAFLGSTGAIPLNQPIVAAMATPTGKGYWLVARDGGVFTFGDAAFYGSTGALRLNQPIAAAAATPSGRGYWLIARDGGVFTFGDAAFLGSMGAIPLNQPIVAATSTPTGAGYWLIARDGGVFTFGDAAFAGAAVGRLPAGAGVVGMAPARTGYWLAAGGGPVTLAFAGDVHGERQIGVQLRAGGNPLAELAPVLGGADITAVNLETAVGPPGDPQAKEFVFLAPEQLLDALVAAGVDVVTLANNHALDHGRDALARTIALAEARGLVVIGAGADAAEAYAPHVVEVRGRRVAYVGLSRVDPGGWGATATRSGVASGWDEAASLAAVRSAAVMADTVVVFLHWGVELDRCPDAASVRFAQQLHAAGADVVVGAHPHVLQGVVSSPSEVTAYSLGNFVWYHDREPSRTTGVLQVAVDGGGALATSFVPAQVGPDGHPRALSGSAADAVTRSVTAGGASGCWVG